MSLIPSSISPGGEQGLAPWQPAVIGRPGCYDVIGPVPSVVLNEIPHKLRGDRFEYKNGAGARHGGNRGGPLVRCPDMLRIRPTIVVLILCVLGACRSRDDGRRGTPEARLPHVTAPIDTTIVIETQPDTATVASTSEAALQSPAWTDASFRGLPEPKALHYTRYTNSAFGYSIAYPDTLLKPGEPVGEHRGREFTSPAGRIRMLVFAVEATTPEDLNTQYRAALEDPETVITYRARDDRSYIVSGVRGEEIFYEKSISDGETLKTFRIQYPAAHKAYFDAVAAIMSASFEHLPTGG